MQIALYGCLRPRGACLHVNVMDQAPWSPSWWHVSFQALLRPGIHVDNFVNFYRAAPILVWIHPLLGKPMHMLMEYSYFSFILICEIPPNLPAHKTEKLRGCAEPFVSSPVVSKEVYILDIYQIVICLTGGYYVLNFPKRWLTIMIHIFLGTPFPQLPFAGSGGLHVSFLGVEENGTI